MCTPITDKGPRILLWSIIISGSKDEVFDYQLAPGNLKAIFGCGQQYVPHEKKVPLMALWSLIKSLCLSQCEKFCSNTCPQQRPTSTSFRTSVILGVESLPKVIFLYQMVITFGPFHKIHDFNYTFGGEDFQYESDSLAAILVVSSLELGTLLSLMLFSLHWFSLLLCVLGVDSTCDHDLFFFYLVGLESDPKSSFLTG